MSRIHLIRETWSHMADVSGFDPLFACLQEQLANAALSHYVPNSLLRPGLVRRVMSKLAIHPQPRPISEFSPYVHAPHCKVASACLTILEQHPDDVLLLSAGENQFAAIISQSPASIRKRIYVCLHQPPAWFRLHWKDRAALSGLGGIFSLCKEQAEFLRDYSGSPVHEIRHGVCLDFFQPAATSVPLPSASAPRFLFVGQWLRDFETLAKTIPLILADCPQARFDLVVPHSARRRECLYPIARLAEVEWHAGISPEALRGLYQNAQALLLPLVDATANNAIIEATACGIPVITSDVGGIRDYLPEGTAIICPPLDPAAHAKAAAFLHANPEVAHTMGKQSRAHAVDQLCHAKIAEQVSHIISHR